MAAVTQLGRVLVPVADQDEAIRFYTEKLGFTVTADIPFGEGDRWVEVAPPEGTAAIALVPPQGEYQPGRMTGIGLVSPDPKALHAELKQKGVDVDDEILGGDGTVPLLFFFRDNNGNQLLLAEAR
jgi:catechol 2,3-dioxygenase-like lactoylglutathione lyase family enzyme